MSDAPEKKLAWRIEQACFKAWPALKEKKSKNWLLRFSNGLSRRANSANPLCSEAGDVDAAIAECETKYRAAGLPTYFRLPAIIEPAMEKRLRQLRYAAEGESLVLNAGIEDAVAESGTDMELLPHANPEWLWAMGSFQGHDKQKSAIYRQMIKSITVPSAFASLRAEDQIVSLGYGIVYDGLLCFESVITDTPFRGRGHARRLLMALVAWAKSAGAGGVCLQVKADNQPAIALYNGLGLKELYRYHYEREPV